MSKKNPLPIHLKKSMVVCGQGKYDNHLHHMRQLRSVSYQQSYSYWKSLTHGEFFELREVSSLPTDLSTDTATQLEVNPVAKTILRAFGGLWPFLGIILLPCVGRHEWLFLLLGTNRKAALCDHVLLHKQRFTLCLCSWMLFHSILTVTGHE